MRTRRTISLESTGRDRGSGRDRTRVKGRTAASARKPTATVLKTISLDSLFHALQLSSCWVKFEVKKQHSRICGRHVKSSLKFCAFEVFELVR